MLQKFAAELTRDLRAALVTPTGKGLQCGNRIIAFVPLRFLPTTGLFLCNTNSPAGTPVLYQRLTDQLGVQVFVAIELFCGN